MSGILLKNGHLKPPEGAAFPCGFGVPLRPRQTAVQSGFSLMELLIVVAIIAIAVGMTVPNLSSFNRTYWIRDDADRIAAFINVARMRSISTFARVEVLCNSTTKQCSLQSKPWGASAFTADSDKQTLILSSVVSFGSPASASAGVGGQTSITPYQGSKTQSISYAMIFNSRGLPIADPSGVAVSDYALYLSGPNNTYMAVGVDASGRASVYSYISSTWQLMTN